VTFLPTSIRASRTPNIAFEKHIIDLCERTLPIADINFNSAHGIVSGENWYED
jgi:hypothetical protein